MKDTSYKMLILSLLAAFSLLIMIGCEEVDEEEQRELELKEQRTEQIDRLFGTLPDDEYFAIGFVDLDSMLDNRWGEELLAVLPMLPDSQQGNYDINDYHQVIFAVKTDPKDFDSVPEVVAIVHTELSEQEALNFTKEGEVLISSESFEGYTIHQFESDFSFAFLGSGRLVFGTRERVENTIRVVNGDSQSYRDSHGMRMVKENMLPEENFWFAVPGAGKLFDELAVHNSIFRNWRAVDFAYIAMSFGDSFATRVVAECDSEKTAGMFSSSIRGFTGFASTILRNSGVDQLDIGDLDIDPSMVKNTLTSILDNLEIYSEEKKVFIELEIPEEIIESYVEVTKQLWIKSMMDSENKSREFIDREDQN